ncbi:hypothetical protein BGZ80_005710 [Entomortierella chlamydospora]|uniref:Uncharacterized protein n=1 Tax=Entomortierella chlamydospora TaxID=101097 RepID=A0A9P6MJF9_9FUNG|nr:hypothetical protein BGZ80_005710 [Entomortierella chlamydospora]
MPPVQRITRTGGTTSDAEEKEKQVKEKRATGEKKEKERKYLGNSRTTERCKKKKRLSGIGDQNAQLKDTDQQNHVSKLRLWIWDHASGYQLCLLYGKKTEWAHSVVKWSKKWEPENLAATVPIQELQEIENLNKLAKFLSPSNPDNTSNSDDPN